MEKYLIQTKKVFKSYDKLNVLNDVNINVSKGEVVSIIGPSGSGKTTFLRCINLLTEYDSGSILLDGIEIGFDSSDEKTRKKRNDKDLSVIRSDIGMVFQLFYLFPHLTALENVTLGLTKVRKYMCERITEDTEEIGYTQLEFIIALGEQCFLNEYVFSFSEEEKTSLNIIIARM